MHRASYLLRLCFIYVYFVIRSLIANYVVYVAVLANSGRFSVRASAVFNEIGSTDVSMAFGLYANLDECSHKTNDQHRGFAERKETLTTSHKYLAIAIAKTEKAKAKVKSLVVAKANVLIFVTNVCMPHCTT